jgi:hypothetical protein
MTVESDLGAHGIICGALNAVEQSVKQDDKSKKYRKFRLAN